jgi:hypothetical protein
MPQARFKQRNVVARHRRCKIWLQKRLSIKALPCHDLFEKCATIWWHLTGYFIGRRKPKYVQARLA